MKKIIGLIGTGISWGCTVSCIISMVGYSMMGNDWFLSASKGFNQQIIASMIIGMGWSLPSLIYQNEKLSFIQQWIFHMLVGVIVYIPIAFYMEWFPKGNIFAIIISMGISLVCSLIIWFCFYLYYKNEAKVINKKIQDKKL